MKTTQNSAINKYLWVLTIRSKRSGVLLFPFIVMVLTSFVSSGQTGLRINGAKLIIPSGAVVRVEGGQSGDLTTATRNAKAGKIDLDGTISLDGDWINNNSSGNILVNRDTDGKVVFSGTTRQYLRSANTRNFYFEDIQVNASATFELADTQNLTLEDDFILHGNYIHRSRLFKTASFIFDDISGNGISRVDRHLTRNHWHMVGLPVTSATSNEFHGMYLYYWNESTGWKSINSTSRNLATISNKGVYEGFYAKTAWQSNDHTVDFTGTLNCSETTLTLTRSTGQPIFQGFHIIGNPYVASLDWHSMFTNQGTNNVTDGIWVRDESFGTANNSTYSVSGGGINGGSRYVAVGQAFWVQVAGGNSSGTFQIQKNDRLHSSQAFRGETDRTRVVLTLESESGQTDQAAIAFTSEGTNDFDEKYDLEKMFVDGIPQIYSYAPNGKEVCINNFSEILMNEVERVPLSTELTETGNQITVDLENIPIYMNVYLEDLESGYMQDMRHDNAYAFLKTTTSSNRDFVLHFVLNAMPADDSTINWQDTITNTITGNEADRIKIYSYDDVVYIQNPEGIRDLQYRLFDLNGKLLDEGEIPSIIHKLELYLAKSQYIIQVYNDSSLFKSKRLIIR